MPTFQKRMLATNRQAAIASRARSPCDKPSIIDLLASRVTTRTRPEAGSSRRARRAQKLGSEMVPVVASSRSSSDVIRKPDSTKNTSTPMNPPGTMPNLAWYTSTSSTATERSPSMSGRKVVPCSASHSARGGTVGGGE